MFDSYLNTHHELLEESRKSWDYLISNKIVYLAEPRDGKWLGRKEGHIKNYIEGCLWFEFVAHMIGSQE